MTSTEMAVSIGYDVAAFLRGCERVREIIDRFCHEAGMLCFLFAPGIASDVQAAIRYARS